MAAIHKAAGVFAYSSPILLLMKQVGTEWKVEWPKLGPSILIATALIVAIRTAKWSAKAAGDPHVSDVDPDLDREISFASRISMRLLHDLLKRHETIFPGRREPIYDGIHEEDISR